MSVVGVAVAAADRPTHAIVDVAVTTAVLVLDYDYAVCADSA